MLVFEEQLNDIGVQKLRYPIVANKTEFLKKPIYKKQTLKSIHEHNTVTD